MTREEFIAILDKAGIAYETNSSDVIYVDDVYILDSSFAYIHPGKLGIFNTSTIATLLKDLKPEDLEPMIAHYRKFHSDGATSADTEPSDDAYVRVSKEEWEQLKAENARLKDVLERHGIKLLK